MNRLQKLSINSCLIALGFIALSAIDAQAQTTREQLITEGIRAKNNFEPLRAIDLLRTAADPNLGTTDSRWAFGVQQLAELLVEQRLEQDATYWLRWAFRLDPNLAIDSVTFLPEVVATVLQARDFVRRAQSDDAAIGTSWIWPPLGTDENTGLLRVDHTMSASVIIEMDGGAIQSGQRVAPGSHTIRLSASGYTEASIDREILPGVTTVLTVNLAPTPVAPGTLPPAIETATAGQVASILPNKLGAPECATAFFVGRDGLLLTTYEAIRGADGLVVVLSDGRRIVGAQVANHDVSANIAVIKIPITSSDSLVMSDADDQGQRAWAFGHPDCAVTAPASLRVTGLSETTVELGDGFARARSGMPVISQDGRVLALGTGRRAAVRAVHAQSIVNEARRRVAAGNLMTAIQVAEQERHRFGAVAIRSDLAGATGRVESLETWHWGEIEVSSPLPFTFAGPMGRYRVSVISAGQSVAQAEMVVSPGVTGDLFVPARVITSNGGGFPGVAVAVILAIGAGVGAFLLLGGEDPGSISVPLPSFGIGR